MIKIWRYILHNESSHNPDKKENFSVVIPFRNEGHNISKIVNQLMSQIHSNSPIEVYLVNDHSTDNSHSRVKELIQTRKNFHVIQSKGEGKKQALSLGIELSKNPWIVTLDADISIPNQWAKKMEILLGNSTNDLLILPIKINGKDHLFQQIEALDFLAMQGITLGYAQKGNPIMANGAHMAFRKSAFNEVDGYQRHINIASGDDVFLLESFRNNKQYSVGYYFDRSFIASTSSSASIKELFNQKLRWAGKTSKVKNTSTLIASMLIFLANSCLILLVFLGLWKPFLVCFALKATVDILFITPINSAYKKDALYKHLWLFILIYPFYITFVPLASLVYKPTWKGRKI